VAAGMALSKKMNGDDRYVFALTGDGELQEGQNWEAIMFAAHHKIDNLIVTVDYNGQQIDGSTKDVMSLGDLDAKWKAFGWKVINLEKGNDMGTIVDTLKAAIAETGQGKPIVILMQTEMGYGVDYMMGTHAWHGKAPNEELTEKALNQLEETLGDYPYPYKG